MQTLQRCAHCGFEMGEGGHACHTEPHLTPEAMRAARQVAGLDLPTRGVYGLPHADSKRERPPARARRRPSWASDFAAFSTMLVLTALLALGLEHVARLDRFAVQLPDGTAELLGRFAVRLAIAAAVMLALALLAATARGISRWRHRGPQPPMVPLAR